MGLMDIEFIQKLMNEVNNMDLPNFITVALIFYVPFYFSKKAETLFFHLLYSSFGVYMLLTMKDPRIIYDLKMLVGLGLLLPQLRFSLYFIQDTIQTIKMMTANTYYFFVTIYYKIIRFFNWLKSTFIMLKTFFTTFSFKKEDYQEQEQSSKHNYSYHESKYTKQESSYSHKEEKSYKKQEQRTNSSSHQREQSYQKQEEPTSEPKKEQGKYGRFSDSSAYVVLGVNPNDDFKTIKIAYKKLVREYHPDLNLNEIEKYTEITQLINSAYEKLKEYKG